MTDINDKTLPSEDNDLFGMKFYYANFSESGFNENNGEAQYNGNISCLKWRTNSNNSAFGYKKEQAFSYFYDNLNQLKEANFAWYQGSSTGWSSNNTYSVNNLDYDANGNIKSLTRNSLIDNEKKVIDNLTYTYNGNKLKKVDDVAEHSVGNDFIDGADEEIEYFYDENGNLISDQNKSINVEYNYMNLPELITFSDGKRIQWIYDANGNKLRKNVYDEEGICTSYKDYANGFVYSDGSLDFFSHAEGRVKALTNGLFEYHYDYKDHLGNIRVTYKADSNNEAQIIQEDHYYPFGVRLAHMSMDGGSNNKYLYNGKELEDDHNLNWYHYGARHYDPQLGRWLQVDPADEFHSPYVYCANTPINAIDPDGRDMIVIYNPVKYGSDHRGHTALLIGNEKDGWKLFSRNGEKYRLFGGEIYDDGVKYGSLSKFATSDKGIDFKLGLRFSTPKEIDDYASIVASKEVKKEYSIIQNNCQDLCADVLNESGINYSKPQKKLFNWSYTDPQEFKAADEEGIGTDVDFELIRLQEKNNEKDKS